MTGGDFSIERPTTDLLTALGETGADFSIARRLPASMASVMTVRTGRGRSASTRVSACRLAGLTRFSVSLRVTSTSERGIEVNCLCIVV